MVTIAAPRKDNVKDIILNSALKLLETKTISDISLSEIAKNAGVSKGTLYYYYKSKNEILFDIFDCYLEEQWNSLILWTEDKNKDTSVHRLIRYVVERNIASANIRSHLLNDAMFGNEDMRQKILLRYHDFAKLIAEKICERTNGISSEYLTWLILLVSDGLIIQENLKNDDFDIEKFIDYSINIIKKTPL
ncbi:MAG: TetR/AcrR family transcriptional regulator [Oscillospiraceae bacterium]